MPHSNFWPFARNNALEGIDDAEKSSGLQKQLGDMEDEVKEMQMELAAMKRDRLEINPVKQRAAVMEYDVIKESSENRHTEDGGKSTQVLKLQEELIRAKNTADQERFQREKYEAKLKDLEMKLNLFCGKEITPDVKEYRKFTEEDVNALKMQMRNMKDEMEEMQITVAEKAEQLQEYRIKYLQAQEQVEELRRQLDVIEYDNKQVSDQIQIEIQKMKIQFQEKLQELSPLPDLLKGAQIQLQEAKQMQRLAEDSSHQLSNELHRVKEKLVIAVNSLNQERGEKTKLSEENKALRLAADEREKEIEELTKSYDECKCKVLRLEEKLNQQEMTCREKSVECMQLLKDLDELKAESSRSLGRCRERSDSMRRYLQTQISEMERQLVQTRAQCRACQKERDEIRQRMHLQINNLQENFELVEMRLRALQNQVTSLKSSYTVILGDDDDELNKITGGSL